MKSSAAYFEHTDCLYGRLRPYLNKVVVPGFEGLASAEFIVLPDSAQLSSRFLQYRLSAKDFVSFASHINTGDRPRVDFEQIAEFQILLPPKDQQQQIVTKLDELLSDLDAGVAALKRAQANLKRYQISLLQNLYEQALAWQSLKTIGALATELKQGWSPKCSSESVEDESWGVIKTTAVGPMKYFEGANKKLPATLAPRPELKVEPNDLLITRAGPRSRCGICCLVHKTTKNLMVCDKVYRLRADIKAVYPKYLELILNSPEVLRKLEQQKTGISDSGVNLTQNKFQKIAIPVPPLSAQEVLVRQTNTKLEALERMQSELEHHLSKATSLRQSILKAAFSGQL